MTPTPTPAERGLQKFRKKPVVIEAVQFTREMAEGSVPLPIGVAMGRRSLGPDGRFPEYANDGVYLTNYSTQHRHFIVTLEGPMDVQIGDWIITGVKGERYPCKPDIFAATYEPADTSSARPLPSDWVAVPRGWKLVPFEPTDDMVNAAWECSAATDFVGEHKRIHSATEAWYAMLAAAPSAPAEVREMRVWQCPNCPTSFEYDGKSPPPCPRCDASMALDPTAKTAPEPLAQGDLHSTHHVHRGPESLPCYCAATADHLIGEEASKGEVLARRFHETYERLAPSFGYETRTETRQFDPTTPNGRLMIAVCSELYASPQPAAEGIVPVKFEVRSRYWDGAPWGEWHSYETAEEREAALRPYVNSEWQHEKRELFAAPATPNPPQPSASVGETARELLAAQYDAEGWITEANACRRGISGAVDRFALRAIESSLTQQDTSAAEHWHGLYRKECRLRQDDAARYGQQIVDLESALTTAAAGGE